MGEQVKEFETINTELNHESAGRKGIYKKNKLILIISATLIAIILFVVLLIAVIIPTSKANAYIEKLDTWVSLMNFEGVSKEERESTAFKNKIKDLHEELGFSFSNRVEKIPMDALRKYILTNDVDRLLTATMNANNYDYHNALWVVYETVYELYPEKFTKVILDENATSGYYIDNPTENPGETREVESERKGYTDLYKITHYGDFAVLEETRWGYNDGKLGWENGVFYDEPGYWFQRTYIDVYYKGKHFWTIYDSLSEVQGVMFYETDTHFCKLYYREGHLTNGGYSKKDTN
ncbi:MAG: hypothetical protein E7659_06710 [Ruminococcaceae bacterium]|nr:hypothetical protein [Oscillospiraceae bacterium]